MAGCLRRGSRWRSRRLSYPTPEAAADALVDGIARRRRRCIKAVVGPDYRKYIRRQAVIRTTSTNFSAAWAARTKIVPGGQRQGLSRRRYERLDAADPDREDRGRLEASTPRARPRKCACAGSAATNWRPSRWRSPTPTRAGDITARTTGTATACWNTRRAALSTPGKRDGLYWASLPGEPESPLGPEFADAKAGQPYHGYLIGSSPRRARTRQAARGATSRDGHMTEGYALIAWPAKYDDTGVMTFIVNRMASSTKRISGRRPGRRSRRSAAYNPDASWTKVAPAK